VLAGSYNLRSATVANQAFSLVINPTHNQVETPPVSLPGRQPSGHLVFNHPIGSVYERVSHPSGGTTYVPRAVGADDRRPDGAKDGATYGALDGSPESIPEGSPLGRELDRERAPH